MNHEHPLPALPAEAALLTNPTPPAHSQPTTQNSDLRQVPEPSVRTPDEREGDEGPHTPTIRPDPALHPQSTPLTRSQNSDSQPSQGSRTDAGALSRGRARSTTLPSDRRPTPERTARNPSPRRNWDNPYGDEADRVVAVDTPGGIVPLVVRGRSLRDTYPRASSRRATLLLDDGARRQSRRTLEDRIDPTLKVAIEQRDKYARRALMTGYALNVATGMQVVLGALTTAIASATLGKQTSIGTAILGGLATLCASYLARARGYNEPEASIACVKDLEQLIRDCEAFKMDYGYEFGDDKPELNKRIEVFRARLEELLGNSHTSLV